MLFLCRVLTTPKCHTFSVLTGPSVKLQVVPRGAKQVQECFISKLVLQALVLVSKELSIVLEH